MQTKPIKGKYEVHALSSRKIVTEEHVAEKTQKNSGRNPPLFHDFKKNTCPQTPKHRLNFILGLYSMSSRKSAPNGETNIKKNENASPWKFNLSSIG